MLLSLNTIIYVLLWLLYHFLQPFCVTSSIKVISISCCNNFFFSKFGMLGGQVDRVLSSFGCAVAHLTWAMVWITVILLLISFCSGKKSTMPCLLILFFFLWQKSTLFCLLIFFFRLTVHTLLYHFYVRHHLIC